MDDILKQWVKERRVALEGSDDGRPPWGLALSGGGIRSATFCLGLLKALAQRRQLLNFDILSTVSGGGYIGATLGRLLSHAQSADDVRAVEGAFAEVESVRFGWWLRANGRYLIPGGLRDTLFAAALYLRNLLATHIELAIAATLVGLVLAALNLTLWWAMGSAVEWSRSSQVPDAAQALVSALAPQLTRLPTLWVVALLPLAASILLAEAFWSVRDRRSPGSLLWQAVVWCGLGLMAFWVHRVRRVPGFDGADWQALDWLAPAFIAFAASWVAALLWVLRQVARHHSPGVLRNQLTDWLAAVLWWVLGLVLLGLLDRAAWWVAIHTLHARVSYGGGLLLAAALLRGVLPTLLSGQNAAAPHLGRSLLLSLGSLLGLLLAFCLAAWWIGVLYAGVLLPVFTPEGLQFARGWIWLAIFGTVLLSYALVTGNDFGFLNVSSLHLFYQARIVRGYLGAANAKRLGADPLSSTARSAPPQVPVGEVHAGDDLTLRDYAPHQHGGPVHLMGCCINQTLDPRQRLFNRDRKSLPLLVGPQGWMQVDGARWAQAHHDGALTLGAWAAISGAAFAPGLGRMTKPGLAALAVFGGFRLGYWWNSKAAGITRCGVAWRSNRLLMKTRYLLRECFGSFPGSDSSYWYLSDGGHFEDTGAYALLQQEAELIVLADCGADPDYRFADLENLIRRARIDFGADVQFLKPCRGADARVAGIFGSLSDLASPNSQACLALAQVRYASGCTGRLVLVKPNVSADLPVDLVNFKQDNPAFPQQSTTDQFFDEAQWESYFRLGCAIGQRLCGPLLACVARGVEDHLFEPDDGQSAAWLARPLPAASGGQRGGDDGKSAAAAAAAVASRLQARARTAGAVAASLSLGTAATLGVAAWQAIDSWRAQTTSSQLAQDVAFQRLTDRWSRLHDDTRPDGAAAALAAELLHTGDSLCRPGQQNFMRNFGLSARIVHDAQLACEREPDNTTPACRALSSFGRTIACLKPIPPQPCAPRYWARDYSGVTGSRVNCYSGTTASVGLDFGRALWAQLPAFVGTASFGVGQSVPATPPAPTTAPVGGSAPAQPSAVLPEATAPTVAVAVGPVGASAAGSQGAGCPPPSLPPARGICTRKVVYIQTFGPGDHDAARSLRAPWQALGASVPPIEDVLATARAAGRASPRGYAKPTILYSEGAQGCACAMNQAVTPPGGSAAWDVVPLPPQQPFARGSVEVWLPWPK